MSSSTVVAITKILDLLQKVSVVASTMADNHRRDQDRLSSVLDESTKALRTIVDTMVKEDRDPTEDEWEEINITTDDIHRRIQSL